MGAFENASEFPEKPVHIPQRKSTLAFSPEDMLDLANSQKDHVFSLAYFSLLGNSHAANEACRTIFVRTWQIIQNHRYAADSIMQLMVTAIEIIEVHYHNLPASDEYLQEDPWMASILLSLSHMSRKKVYTLLLSDMCGMTFDEIALCLDTNEEETVRNLMESRLELDYDMLQSCRLALMETLRLGIERKRSQAEALSNTRFTISQFDLSWFLQQNQPAQHDSTQDDEQNEDDDDE